MKQKYLRLWVTPCIWSAGLLSAQAPAQAQIVAAPGEAGTTVTQLGNQFDIEGGTQAGGNLFHKFDELNVDTGQTANFIGDSSVFNIVGQVSGRNPSHIDGQVQVQGSDANLYLINPAGVLFGPNARLSLQGSFTATTADQVGFDEAWLNVYESGADYSGLTADPSAFRFTSTKASPVVNQADLAVAAGESILLSGGNVVNTGALEAPSGEVGLVAVEGESTVRFSRPGSLLSLEVTEGDIPIGTGGGFATTDLPTLLTGAPRPLASSLQVLPDNSVQLNGTMVEAEEVAIAGAISTRSTTANGGTISLLGRSVDVLEAVVDASGINGGTIRIGGGIGNQASVATALPESDLVLFRNAPVVRADGLAGAGGNIFVGASVGATLDGMLSAQGTARGGSVETSSDNLSLPTTLTVQTAGATNNGRWLIRSDEIEIVAGGAAYGALSRGLIERTLDAGTNVEIITNPGAGVLNDITLSSDIQQTGRSTANLTLTGRQFAVQNRSTINLASTGGLTFNIAVDSADAASEQSASSVEAAIAAIGNVNGERILNLGAGAYDFSAPVSLDTRVDIYGSAKGSTLLRSVGDHRTLDVTVDGDVRLRNLTLSSRNGFGGGVRNFGDLSVDSSQFVGNMATLGGAIFSGAGSTLTVLNSDFSRNQTTPFIGSGGAIALFNAAATIEGSTFSNNIAADDGGALHVRDSVARISTTDFINNASDDDGGGAAVSGSGRTDFVEVTFQGNSANDGGAVVLWDGGQATFDSVAFAANTATRSGGAVDLFDSTATFANSRFWGNRAIAGGGGISAIDSTIVVQGSAFEQNQGSNSGGGLRAINADVTLADSTFVENSAERGGGLAVTGGLSVVENTLFEGNRAVLGGGVATSSGTTVLTNTTLSENSATDKGGAIYSFGPSTQLSLRSSTVSNNRASVLGGGIAESNTQALRILNTIVANNISASAADASGTFEDQGNNLIGAADGSVGFTRSLLVGSAEMPLNPGLAPLANNGGSTKTHLLQSNSFAINAASRDLTLATDQRGLARIVGAAIDIGAVEMATGEVPSNVLNAIAPNQPTSLIPNQPLPQVPAQPVPAPSELSLMTPNFALSEPLIRQILAAEVAEDPDIEQSLQIQAKSQNRMDNTTIRQLEQTFSQSFEDYWDLSSGPDLTFDEVQAILRRAQEEYAVNSAVIYAMFAPEESADGEDASILQIQAEPAASDLLNLSMVMPDGDLVSYQLPVTRQEATQQISLFRTMVSDLEDPFGYRPLAQQLYQWLLAPLEEELAAQNIQNLMYALDSGLRTAPVTAMRDYAGFSATGSSTGFSATGFSLERYGISVVPSVGLMQADFPVPVRRATVAMGVSEFTEESPLPAVPIELRAIESFVPAARTVLNELTTLEALQQVQSLAQPGVLHLATHAMFDPYSPESSSILLWEDPLSMAEFSDLDWRGSDLELLILSACSTALSSANAELGFAGLAAASGVDATIGSLWQVSDIGTLALMSEFYAQLESHDLRFEALRQAQLSLLNGKTRIENGKLITSQGEIALPEDWNLPESATLDHPFFWSAFTMVGNPW